MNIGTIASDVMPTKLHCAVGSDLLDSVPELGGDPPTRLLPQTLKYCAVETDAA